MVSRFICRDETERAWQRDLHLRIQPVMRRSTAIVMAAFLCALPWIEPWSLVPAVGAAAVFGFASRLTTRSGRLDPVVYGWFAAQALLAVTCVLNAADGTSALGIGLFVMMWPLAGAAGGFPTRLVWVCVAFTAALYAGCVLGFDGAAVRQDPTSLIWPITMFVALTIISTAVRDASFDHRVSAAFDPLTGLSNRRALDARLRELTEDGPGQSSGPCFVALDLDHFKSINDEHGHATGDRVLQETAERLRGEVLGSGQAFRVGGEEFLVLLPAPELHEAVAQARRLCEAVCREPVASIRVTVSAGVGRSRDRSPEELEAALARADAALYEAKRTGRNRAVAESIDGAFAGDRLRRAV